MRDDAVLGRALPLDRGLGPQRCNNHGVWGRLVAPNFLHCSTRNVLVPKFWNPIPHFRLQENGEDFRMVIPQHKQQQQQLMWNNIYEVYVLSSDNLWQEAMTSDAISRYSRAFSSPSIAVTCSFEISNSFSS